MDKPEPNFFPSKERKAAAGSVDCSPPRRSRDTHKEKQIDLLALKQPRRSRGSASKETTGMFASTLGLIGRVVESHKI